VNDDMHDEVTSEEPLGERPPGDDGFDVELLEEELRQAATILDPVPARIAELTFDSVVDAIPVRGATETPRMLTFRAGEVTVDVEVGAQGLLGQVLPPQQVRIEVLGGPQSATPVVADDMGRFSSDAPPSGPFALRLRTGGEVVVTEWLRA
jgi:hypothetical protein